MHAKVFLKNQLLLTSDTVDYIAKQNKKTLEKIYNKSCFKCIGRLTGKRYIFRAKVKDLEIRWFTDPKAVVVLGEIF